MTCSLRHARKNVYNKLAKNERERWNPYERAGRELYHTIFNRTYHLPI